MGGKENVHKFIESILPFSIVKKEQLEIGLEFLKLVGKVGPEYREKHRVMYEKIKQLKQEQ